MSSRAMLDSAKIKEAEKKWRQWKPGETMELKVYGKVINSSVLDDGNIYFEIRGKLPLGAISNEEQWVVLRQFDEDYAGVLTVVLEGERNEVPIKWTKEWLDQNQQETGSPYKEKRCPHCEYGTAIVNTTLTNKDKKYKHYICYRCNARWKVEKE